MPVANDNEVTEPHEPLPDDTQAHEVVRTRTAAPPPQPGPPPPVARDVWPWLLGLALLTAAAVLVWLFAFHNRSSASGRVVPAVVGLRQQQAITRLTGDGFDVRALIGPARAPRGVVASQQPSGGSRLDRGQIVVLRVSNGRSIHTTGQTRTTSRSTTTTPAPVTAGVPGVTGQDAETAAGEIEAAGFVAETDPVDAAGAAGSVVAENPAGGSQAAAGSVVRLSVATGPTRPAEQVPGVVGERAGAARAALLAAKLTVKTTYRKGERGVVLAQTPAGGTVPAYTQVTITVGS